MQEAKNLTKSGFHIILDKDPEVSGTYQEGQDGTIGIYLQELSFGFDVREDLYILTTYCSSDAFKVGNGYSIWHERASSNPTIHFIYDRIGVPKRAESRRICVSRMYAWKGAA